MEQIKELVEQFRYNLKDYTSWNFNETNTRQQFIDKFFELLWWDVNNHFWRSEQYKEVVLEDKLRINWQAKAPDYSFRLWGRKIFFVEAKKPSVNIKDEVEPAYQIRRYSWTAKLPIGILTDFQELAIYDTRIKPDPNDKAWFARIAYFTFEEFEENREWIYNTLSKEAVEKWALDKYIQESKKKWTLSVDVDFLNMIDDWRDALAKNIYLRYWHERDWDLDRLNSIVGDIVDKIIFLRIAEDKKIESQSNLENIANGKEVWRTLITYFEKSDKKYNSWLFDNTEIFKKFELDDKILKKILLSLYYPACPYEFSVLGVDILGNIYEKFLGKTLVKEWRTIKTEFKPDVKKAGWVFYTPQYIVDYIVKNTVWELLKWKNPKQALELNIVDPACGSGAFLIWAYDYILNWFLERHTSNDETIKKSIKEGKIYQFKSGYHLSFAYKKEILKNMIYGVDIDRQAVAVSRLSLLLKLLEWETAETANQLFSTIDAALLPKLDNNIKCGNSLIDNSIYANLESPDEATIKKINAFDWEKEFAEVFAKWGFDAVIGNPPYVRIQFLDHISTNFFNKEYSDIVSWNYDLYILFINKGLKLINKNWKIWYILPNKFFHTKSWKPIREILAENKYLEKIVDFWTNQVFDWATTYTCLLFLSKGNKETSHKKFALKDNFKILDNLEFKKTQIESLIKDDMRNFQSDETSSIIDKIISNQLNFWSISKKLFKGSSTWNDKIYLLKYISDKWDNFTCYSKFLDKNIEIEKALLKPFVYGEDIKRYDIESWEHFLIYPYFTDENWKIWVIEIDYIKENTPLTYSYFNEVKQELLKRKIKIWNSDFYKYSAARSLWEYEQKKIMIPDMLVKIRIWYDQLWNLYHWPAIHSVVFNENVKIYHDFYFLSILNSKLFRFFISNTSTSISWDTYRLTPEYLKNFCFPNIDFSSPSQKKKHDDLVSLVDQMILAQKKLKEAEFEDDKKVIEKQIEIIDGKIDDLVFDLYWLSEEERKIVLDR